MIECIISGFLKLLWAAVLNEKEMVQNPMRTILLNPVSFLIPVYTSINFCLIVLCNQHTNITPES